MSVIENMSDAHLEAYVEYLRKLAVGALDKFNEAFSEIEKRKYIASINKTD
jgi:hypothetical protein